MTIDAAVRRRRRPAAATISAPVIVVPFGALACTRLDRARRRLARGRRSSVAPGTEDEMIALPEETFRMRRVYNHPRLAASLRIDPEQRFSCAQCGRCCRRWDVLVTDAERASYVRRGVARWFRETEAGAARDGSDLVRRGSAERPNGDPFEPVPGWRGYHRIRSRADGACGFLSADNRCRLHEELGGAQQAAHLPDVSVHVSSRPRTSVVVTASFGCPTIVANRGELVAAGDAATIGSRSLRNGPWFVSRSVANAPPSSCRSRPIDDAVDLASSRETCLRCSLSGRAAWISAPTFTASALALDDLTRSRVLRLADADFAEYIKLTLPHAATAHEPQTRPAPLEAPSGGGSAAG